MELLCILCSLYVVQQISEVRAFQTLGDIRREAKIDSGSSIDRESKRERE